MVGSKPIFVVHKKPADGADAFSATLYSGAKYTYDKPEKWQVLVDFFLAKLPGIKSALKEKEVPLIWTADFILDWNEKKEGDKSTAHAWDSPVSSIWVSRRLLQKRPFLRRSGDLNDSYLLLLPFNNRQVV